MSKDDINLSIIFIFARKCTTMITEELQKLYQEYTGVPAENITELPSSGSNRRYFRLTGAKTLIGVCGTSVEENDAFLYMAAHFRKSGLPVPEVHIVSENKSYYLQEDLGDTLLFHAIEKGRATSVFSEEEKELLRKTVRWNSFPPKAGPFAPCHTVCRSRRLRLFPLLSAAGVQSAFYPLGFELLQILFP